MTSDTGPNPVARRSGRGLWHRRAFLRAGLAGFASLSLPGLLRLRAEAGRTDPREPTAVILVWLRGGASHLETFDPKPDAPSDYRGPYQAIATRAAGVRVGELLPRLAGISDHFALLRSVAHTGGGHPSGSLQLLSGDPDAQDKLKPVYPDFMSVAHYLRPGPTASSPATSASTPSSATTTSPSPDRATWASRTHPSPSPATRTPPTSACRTSGWKTPAGPSGWASGSGCGRSSTPSAATWTARG